VAAAVVVVDEGDKPDMNRRIDMQYLKHLVYMATIGLALLFLPACNKLPAQAKSVAQEQVEFATPEEAATALLQAFKTNDQEKLQVIFSREGMESVASGDPVSDRRDREVIALAMEQSWRWAPHGPDGMELIIGGEQWPFPVPLVKTGNGWQFDSEEGKEEVLARRIGRNELDIIEVCRAFVDMQLDYASQPHDGKPAGLFAQHLRSTPGRQDGLYWQAKHGERPSPLGDLVAQAAAEGYDPNKPASTPFWGYHFRMLLVQGPAAPGGEKSYVVNGDMTGGFALLAYPSKYAFTGIMIFVVGQDGIVYQKDFGKDTATLAPLLTEYNPDESWRAVQAP
jgi:hypothetical protein